METLVEESDKRVPLICFLSMGSDPTENIMALAKKMNISKAYTKIFLILLIYIPTLLVCLSSLSAKHLH